LAKAITEAQKHATQAAASGEFADKAAAG